ncbi:MAG: CinA family protein [Gammaproteobacteria bacterium]|nr:CinA family protein [Gammaproteobacteria bacterium]
MSNVCHALAHILAPSGLRLATAESCTGGGIAYALTGVPGSSAWFERGYISYSNAAKVELLGVRPETLATHGAVSGEVVCEMVEGVLARSPVDLAVAVSGIAGPDGGSPEKPVGTVWLAWGLRGRPVRSERFLFGGDRSAVRIAAIFAALDGLFVELGHGPFADDNKG